MSQRQGTRECGSGGAELEHRYLTVRQCARYIGRTEAAVYHLVAEARIPYRRLQGRRLVFDRIAIDRWIADSCGVSASDLGRASIGGAP